MFERFTRDARAVVISTQALCHGLGADEVRPVHLLLALAEEGSGVSDLLAAHGITTKAVAGCLGVAVPSAGAPAPLGEDDAAALRSLGIDLDVVRDAVERQFGEGALEEQTKQVSDQGGRAAARDDEDAGAVRARFRQGGHVRFGRSSKKVLELSLREAIRTGAREIRTEHIALGLLRSEDDAVTMVLRALGVDRRAVRSDLEERRRRSA